VAGCARESGARSGHNQQGSKDNGGKLNKYNVATLGKIPTQRNDGAFRILVCQMGSCLGKEVRELKIASTERLITKYKINPSAFMELNYS
jgi:hypothetical protein